MRQHTTTAAQRPEGETVGLDVGDRYTHLCVLDAAGEIVEEGRFRTTPAAIQERVARASRQRVVLETGTHSPWMNALIPSLVLKLWLGAEEADVKHCRANPRVFFAALLGGALLVEDIVGALAGEGLTETKLTAGRERVWGRTTPCVPGSAGV